MNTKNGVIQPYPLYPQGCLKIAKCHPGAKRPARRTRLWQAGGSQGRSGFFTIPL
jgi:hypothetical protein